MSLLYLDAGFEQVQQRHCATAFVFFHQRAQTECNMYSENITGGGKAPKANNYLINEARTPFLALVYSIFVFFFLESGATPDSRQFTRHISLEALFNEKIICCTGTKHSRLSVLVNCVIFLLQLSL